MSSKKDDIISLAVTLIKKKGFLALSYDNISKEMNITKTAIHYYFEKKEDLGIAVCEKLQKGLVQDYEKSLNQIMNGQDGPWFFVSSRISTIGATEMCPISSLQADYEELPDRMKNMLEKISSSEMKLWSSLVKQYASDADSEALAKTSLLSVKGALQYRRVLGDSAFSNMMQSIQDQFFESLNRMRRC
ncbi:TetR/AcrR family transcriptional repressor of nem operon [Clostridium acetobutylicum]|jgi:TetR/AcrR family transcriptional repressor of nem operon|uniref:HTH transcriptional regulator TetR/AcrR family n=1 Tax=Clostridium acetobutylicum (strain ATCC 824 / DSM 792 / JCM 1419 / IAM 19013 / LMG 5710 / NBRC 13948 / NRRL B-527 / VKM B-1787 / 2291 / W) TaxID=272562 RepID=Q97TL3_CLOAB|nr:MULTISPECIES: TetR/AcrR family transcriptional regulator [Clostridium]AAK76833.1 HTH transcriptional regulator TetR/AcrR family [Clostridium acetobutylicum ATCC 824]ADZ22869.1 HTH transcriptional regulator TetR/AcrR family [Clostridium acetobutylicum EA 2018]AEI34829.1 TetR/AcrR family transcriptional regulator [Clostridium acetobutylicum DSM 1731]AWV82376.1 TetR/AcrR family transcriptional regulator [Clostridium acetobutylicum]MBC2395779.1 TetR/AcrR family transcriptional regulator [Clostr